jgi:hypothetical protein
MPDEQPIPDPAERYRQIELEILMSWTDPEDNQPLWTLEDLAREMEERDIAAYTRLLQACATRGAAGAALDKAIVDTRASEKRATMSVATTSYRCQYECESGR